MINWLVEQQILLSLVLVGLLAGRRVALRWLGAGGCYRLWWLAPLALLVAVMPTPVAFVPVTAAPVQQYLVLAGEYTEVRGFTMPLVGLWAMGVAGLLTFWGLAQYNFIRSLALRPVELPSELGKSLPATLRVRASASVGSALITGLWRPTLVLPDDFQQRFSPRQRQLILQHELCHWQRGDLLWNALALVTLAACWFNPLCWLAYRRFRQDQELACDEQVLRQAAMPVRIDYGKALVRSLESRAPFGALHLQYGSKQTMVERIQHIREQRRPMMWRWTMVLAVGLVLLSGISQAVDGSGMAKPADKAGPAPLMRIEPSYPPEAARQGITGEVLLVFDVTAGGHVDNIEVLHSRPAGVFDLSASEALARWRYEATGRRSRHKVMLNFALDAPQVDADVEKIKVTPH